MADPRAAVPEATRRLIEDLIHDVARVLDDDRLEEFSGFFVAEGAYKVVSRDNLERGLPFAQINCISRGMIEDRMVSVRRGNIFPRHRYRHLIGSIEVRPAEDRLFSAQSSFLLARTLAQGLPSLFASGEYRDSIAFECGVPLFRERIVVLDADGVETLMAVPP
jgi:anthranilate 1,2-dioxygenase small subunit